MIPGPYSDGAMFVYMANVFCVGSVTGLVHFHTKNHSQTQNFSLGSVIRLVKFHTKNHSETQKLTEKVRVIGPPQSKYYTYLQY